MEYWFVPVHEIFLKVQERTKITKYLAPATQNLKIPLALRFDYVGRVRDSLVRRFIVLDALSSE